MKKGYNSNAAKSYKLSKAHLSIKVKGLRNFWSILYGVNASGSPRKFSSLMERANNQRIDCINGWDISKDTSKDELPWRVHNTSLGIMLSTNDPISLFKELFSLERDNSELSTLLNGWNISKI